MLNIPNTGGDMMVTAVPMSSLPENISAPPPRTGVKTSKNLLQTGLVVASSALLVGVLARKQFGWGWTSTIFASLGAGVVGYQVDKIMQVKK
jgi:hypothetical protein